MNGADVMASVGQSDTPAGEYILHTDQEYEVHGSAKGESNSPKNDSESHNHISNSPAAHTSPTGNSGLAENGECVEREVDCSGASEKSQRDKGSGSEANVQNDAESQGHRCDLCGETFKLSRSFQAHISTHSKNLDLSLSCSESGDSESSETNASDPEWDLSGDENAEKPSTPDSKRKRKRQTSGDSNIGGKALVSGFGAGKSSDHVSVEGGVDSEDDARAYECDKCGNKYTHAKGLKAHLPTHSSAKAHKCDICKKAYAKRDVLLRHRREVHFKERGKAKMTKKVACDLCGKVFAALDHLKKHKLHHSEKRPYKCDKCEKAFVLKGDLTKHYMTHTQEKPHKCKVCNRGFARNSTLKKHLRTHTGEKPYECDICGEAFARYDVLTAHQRFHSGELRYKCETCGMSYHLKPALVAHFRAGNCQGKRLVRIPNTAGRVRRSAKNPD